MINRIDVLEKLDEMFSRIAFDVENAYYLKGVDDMLNSKDIAELIFDTNKLSSDDRKSILISVIYNYVKEYSELLRGGK